MTAKTGQAGLLLWCQRVTKGYKNVDIQNFHTSWRSGLGFCAILHKFRPELIDFDSLEPSKMLENNELAFRLAEKCGVHPLLDAEDMLLPKPEQFSVITYLAQWYNVFEKGIGATQISLGQSPNTTTNSNVPVPVQVQPEASSLSRVSVNTGTASKPNCFACGNPLTGNVTEWENHFYHEKCFKCVGCNELFDGKNLSTIMKFDERPYCEKCGANRYVQHTRKSQVHGPSAGLTPSQLLRQNKLASQDQSPSTNNSNSNSNKVVKFSNVPTVSLVDSKINASKPIEVIEESTIVLAPVQVDSRSSYKSVSSPRVSGLLSPRNKQPSQSKDQLDAMKQQISLLESREDNYKSRLAEMETKEKKNQSDIAGLLEEKKDIVLQLAALEKKSQLLQRQLSDLETTDADRRREQQARLNLDEKLHEVEQKLSRSELKLKKSQDKLCEAGEKIKSVESTLEKSSEKLREAESKQKHSDIKLKNNEEKLRDAEERIRLAESNATKSIEKVKSTEELLKRKDEEFDAAEEKWRHESALVEKYQIQLKHLTKSAQELQLKLEESELSTLKNAQKISQLEATTSTLEIEKNKAKNLAQLTLSSLERQEKSNAQLDRDRLKQIEKEDKERQLQWEDQQNKLLEKEKEVKTRERNNAMMEKDRLSALEADEKERNLRWEKKEKDLNEKERDLKTREEILKVDQEALDIQKKELATRLKTVLSSSKKQEDSLKKNQGDFVAEFNDLKAKKLMFEKEKLQFQQESNIKNEKFVMDSQNLANSLKKEKEALLDEMIKQKELLMKDFQSKQLKIDADKELISKKFFELKQFENELNQKYIVLENLQQEWDEAFDVLEERERILKEKEDALIVREERLLAQIMEAPDSPRGTKSAGRTRLHASGSLPPKLASHPMRREDELIQPEELSQMRDRFATKASVINFDQYMHKGFEGYLDKAEDNSNWGSLFGWTKFWFKLVDCRLFFYKKKPERQDQKVVPDGIISAQLATMIEHSGEDTIVITFPERDFSLRASSNKERNEWFKAIIDAKVISEKLQKYTQAENNPASEISRLVKKSDLRKEGYVDVSYFFGWSKMYFVLVDGMLLVFNSKGGSRKHKIPLFGSSFSAEPSDKGLMTTFIIYSPEATRKELKCSCQTEEQTQQWLTVLLKQKLLIEEAVNGLKFD